MANHSLDIAAFKGVSVVFIPVLLFSLVGATYEMFTQSSNESLIGSLFSLFFLTIGYYIVSGLGWISWGAATVYFAKNIGVSLRLSVLISVSMFFCLLTGIVGLKVSMPLTVVAGLQALAFLWYGRTTKPFRARDD